jgi:parallel beta-helix repeat protein
MQISSLQIRHSKADSQIGPVYIRADGSVDPVGAPISAVINSTYTLTGNISSSENGIIIERDDITINGNGYWLNGQDYTGMTLSGRSNVKIQNMKFTDFQLGIYLENCFNVSVSGSMIMNNQYGIGLYSSSNNTLANNELLRCNEYGIFLDWTSYSNHVTGNNVTEDTTQGTPTGIMIYGDNNIISSNTVTNFWVGIGVYGLYNSLTNNIISSNLPINAHGISVVTDAGIDRVLSTSIDESNTIQGKHVYYWVNKNDVTVPSDAGFVALINCTRIIVENLQISRNYHGIMLFSTTNSTIRNNQIYHNYYGIWLYQSSQNLISQNNITLSDGYGIGFEESSRNNRIVGNQITLHNYGAIYFHGSSDNSIEGNYIATSTWVELSGKINGDGIVTANSNNITISGNLVKQFGAGIVLAGQGNTLTGNTVTESTGDGLVLTSNNVLKSNNISGNGYGIQFGSLSTLSDLINDVDVSNIINGKPIYYWVDQHDKTVPTDAGYVVLVSCSNILVQNLHLSGEHQGIGLFSTTSSTIIQNHLDFNDQGIFAMWSSNNNISRNTIDNNAWEGIRLFNNINDPTLGCNNNFISENTFKGNYKGCISIWDSTGNVISRNNFLINGIGLVTGQPNMWDNGYPDGGNYWDSYVDVDMYQGPGQNLTGSDGIWDHQLNITQDGNIDHYPLVGPTVPIAQEFYPYGGFHVNTLSNSSILSYQFTPNTKTMSFNVTGQTGTQGFIDITFENQFIGGPYTVLVDGSSVTPTMTSNATHTTLHIEYTHSTHEIQIIGTTAIPEIPTIPAAILVLILLAATLIGARRKLIPQKI